MIGTPSRRSRSCAVEVVDDQGGRSRRLSALTDLGLDDVAVNDALTYLLTFVQAAAGAAIESAESRHASAMDDQQWWSANAPLLARLVDPGAYPTATRIGTAAGAAHGSAYNPDHAYAYGLDRVLDGLARLIERPAAPSPR